jgi:hypothetical protein
MNQRAVTEVEITDASVQGRRAVNAGADYLHVRRLPNGRAVYLLPYSFGWLRLNIGHPGGCSFDDEWLFQGEQWKEAWRAALGWDGEGEPEGWSRHPATGRRRPDGDAKREFVRW